MTELHFIGCDNFPCKETISAKSHLLATWSILSIQAPSSIVPEVTLGEIRPAGPYTYVSAILRAFCPKCTELITAAILAKRYQR